MTRQTRTKLRIEAARRSRGIARHTGNELRQAREDAGLAQRRVAALAGISQSHYSEIEAGSAQPSIEALAAIALALGGELAVRFHPGTGPRIRDRIQAAMVEAFLVAISERWERWVEVPVHRPSAGVIDLVLADATEPAIVAAEFQSQIHRLEQQLRWARTKADSLASAAIEPLAGLAAKAPIGRLLVLRSTRETRALAIAMERTLASAYPARTADVIEAIRGTGAWPGAGVIWMSVDRGRAVVMDRPPRGVKLGR
jgi:transcriptional regulator with XRE-family HTH domain